MGYEDVVAARNARNYSKLTDYVCKEDMNDTKTGVLKFNSSGDIEKYNTDGSVFDPKLSLSRVSTYKTDENGTVTEYNKSGGKVKSWKTDSDGKIYEYNSNDEKQGDKYWKTDSYGLTKEYGKDGTLKRVFVPGSGGRTGVSDTNAKQESKFLPCNEKEARRNEYYVGDENIYNSFY